MRNLLKAAAKTGSSTIASLIFGAITMKIIAAIMGPSGVGLFSLLRQTQQTASIIGSVGGQNALIQGLASRDGTSRESYLSTAFWVMASGTIFVTIFTLGVAQWIAPLLLGKQDSNSINLIRWLAIPNIMGVLLAFFIGVLNGFRAIGRLAWLNVIMTGSMALVAYPLSLLAKSGYEAAFVFLLSIGLAAGCALAGLMIARAGWLKLSTGSLVRSFRIEAFSHFFRIGGTTLITSMMGTLTVLAIRAFIIHKGGLHSAGVFDVAWTLSMMYVMLALTSFGTYYLPTLSNLTDVADRVCLIKKMFRFSTIVIVAIILILTTLRPLLIQILYTSEFTSSLKIIRWMLIGDFFKVTSWVLSMTMIAYADMKSFFWSELVANSCFLLISLLLYNSMDDLQGIGIAFMFLYVIYLAYMIHYAKKRHNFSISKDILLVWLLGFMLVLLASIATWSLEVVKLSFVVISVVSSFIFIFASLTGQEREWCNMKIRGLLK